MARRKAERPDLLFRAVVEAALDPIVVIDGAGVIRSVNQASERVFGYEAAELVGRNVEILMPEPYAAEHDSYIANYLRTGTKKIIGIGRDVSGRRKDGTIFPMSLAVGETAVEGETIFVGIIHDLTDREAAGRRIQDLQAELLHASRLSVMGQMASTLAHELNQPLTAVMNYLAAARQLLQNDPQSTERAGDLIGRAVAQAERAGEVIRNLRQFVSKGETERRAQSLNRLVEEALGLALVGTRQSGVRVSLDLDRNLLPVLVDGVQIQQVVLNLVRNAVEAMEGVERRELSVVTLGIAGESIAEVRIADSGPGIAHDIAERLFQPFVTTKKTGMGLGLSICREIVESHHGRLAAAPNPSGGTVFRLTLPVSPAVGAEGEAAGGQ
ncbi:MAG TPA: PAS domain S-box protein [Stellaceae bacterium]|nr:PAS domain S-box protein [Stellaceae bacterium]